MRRAPNDSSQFCESTVYLRIDTLIQQDLQRYNDEIDSACGIRPDMGSGLVRFEGSRQILAR
jgi:hypothetical protein